MNASTPLTGQVAGFEGFECLRRVCLGADIPLGLFEPYVNSFSEFLNANYAISLGAQSGWVGMSTQASGQLYVYRILEFLEKSEVSERNRQQFLSLAKHFDSRRIGLKVEVDHRSLREIATVFGGRHSMDVMHAVLADSGLDADSVGLTEAVAEVLMQAHAMEVGCAIQRGGVLIRWAAFDVEGCSDGWSRLHAASILCGFSDAEWAPLAALRKNSGCEPAMVLVRFSMDEVWFSIVLEPASSSIVESLPISEKAIQSGMIPLVIAPKHARTRMEIGLRPGKPISLTTFLLE